MYRTPHNKSHQPPRRRLAPRKPEWSVDADDGYPPIAPSDLPAQIVIPRVRGVSGSRPQWWALCPAHRDIRPSLSLTEVNDGSLLIYCHAGCTAEQIMEAIGLDLSYLYPSGFALRFGTPRLPIGMPMRDHAPETVDEPVIDYARFEAIVEAARSHPEPWLGKLARSLRLPGSCLEDLRVGLLDDRWVFAEVDDRGRTVGIVYRSHDGSKTCEPGSRRGLSIPLGRMPALGAVYLVEGVTDAAALHSVEAAAVGRPAARASSLVRLWLVRLLRDRSGLGIIVVGDRDPVRDGKSTGRDGARQLAEYLAGELGRDVAWALPRAPYKDVREQVVAGDWHRGLVVKEVGE